jgi:predicted amidophosphoribosyltransferase
VFELAGHGLDLAAALERELWMTARAAEVTEELLIPAPAGARLRAETGWDRVTLIAKLTGRSPLTSVESRLIEPLGSTRLALG